MFCDRCGTELVFRCDGGLDFPRRQRQLDGPHVVFEFRFHRGRSGRYVVGDVMSTKDQIPTGLKAERLLEILKDGGRHLNLADVYRTKRDWVHQFPETAPKVKK